VLNYIDFGMNVQQALEQPTVITSAFRAYRYPNAVGKELAVSARIPDDVREELRRLGHSVTSHTALGVGSVKAIAVDLHRGVLMGGAAPEADAYVLGR
jgi:gamma-glutamyltranspeptidase